MATDLIIQRYSCLLAALVLIVVASILTNTPWGSKKPAAKPNKLKIRKHCGFKGNSDIYSLGIRIGAYLQWFATWLATL
jgi:hypothetical protein